MLDLPGYSFHDRLQVRSRAFLFRGLRELDHHPVIIKIHRNEYPEPADIAHFQHEFQITHALELPGVLPALSIERHGNGLALVLEDPGGVPLDEIIARGPLDLATFLNIASRLATILGQIHARDIVHCDIQPANIFYDAAQGDVWLTDFGIASRLSRETRRSVAPEMLDGSLAYISPEQTGRMNRSIDYRTDLYSLGVSLYEMLTGRPPFAADDPIEMVYSHIARRARAPGELRPGLPDQIDRIIARLLEKNAEDRYQSANGLGADLRECGRRLSATGSVASFPLGREDRNDSPQVPQKLYGRESETRAMLEHFARVSQEGNPELLIISGRSGSGKSALVREVQRPIVERRGYFAAGKFDQLNRNTPYSALILAVQELIREVLTEGSDRIDLWRERLRAALGGTGRVLTDAIPRLELIVGETEPVADLPPNESRNRFQAAFINLLRVFAGADHPFVLFLDDLQWADAATLSLLEQLTRDPELGYFMLVGAVRENETRASHPFTRSLDTIRKDGARIGRIDLGPLDANDLSRMVAETLNLTPNQARPLADIVLRKTGGNPFFAIQFILNLFNEKLLMPDSDLGWRWDTRAIAGRDFSENVVEFMSGQIDRLPEPTRQLLRVGAGIGDSFDLATLALAADSSPDAALRDLWSALKEEYLLPLNDAYKHAGATDGGPVPRFRFPHDRIRQAAYTMIAEDERPGLHLKIARSLFRTLPSIEHEIIFDMTNHFNAGSRVIDGEVERIGAAMLNHQAAGRARASGAFETALGYVKNGLALLPVAPWDECYSLTLDLNLLAAECSYLTGDYEASERLFAAILEHARNRFDRNRVYFIQAIQFSNQGLLTEALRAGDQGLRLFGVSVPLRTGRPRMLFTGILPAWLARGWRSLESIVDAADIASRETNVVMRTFSTMMSPAYSQGPELFAMIVSRAVYYTLRHGLTRYSAFPLMLYASVLGSGLGLYTESLRFSRLALKLRDRITDPESSPLVSFAAGTFVNHWTRPLEECIELLRESHTSAAENGNLIYACYALAGHSSQSFFRGTNLVDLGETLDHNGAYVEKVGDPWMMRIVLSIRQMVRNLRGLTTGPDSFSDRELNEEEFLARTDRGTAMDWWPFCQAFTLYHYGRFEAALEQIEKSEATIRFSLGQAITREHTFLYSLILTALLGERPNDRRAAGFREILGRNQKQLKLWARHGPGNCLDRYLLVRAEMARIDGHPRRALDLYDQAMEIAHKNGFIQNEALAGELIARLYLKQGKVRIARNYMTEARHAYGRWGARAKVEQIDTHPDYASLNLNPHVDTETSDTTTKNRGTDLDMKTVLKASRAISGELRLGPLLDTVLRLAMENTGAARGCLLLERDGEYVIEADVTEAETDDPGMLHGAFAPSVVHYAARTGETVLLDDAARAQQFKNDAYLRETRMRSLLCLPIKLQNKIIAVLYLENRRTRSVFTPRRLKLLELISGQTAVSIENARLYELATTDMMTRLKLRHVFQTELARARDRSARSGEPLSLIVTDIDHFKSFNDTYGHQTGDAVLIEVARVLIEHERPGETAARYGGEEFCLILPGVTAEEALIRADAIRQRVSELRVEYEGRSLEVTLSAGIARFDSRSDKENKHLIEKADQALYRAKDNGRNCCEIYDGI